MDFAMIVYFGVDLIFATRIGATSRAVGVSCQQVGSVGALCDLLRSSSDDVKGQGHDFERSERPHPPVRALMVDLDAPEAIAAIEASRAVSASLNILAFGPHVAADLLEAARQSGASQVFPRSRFASQLEGLIRGLSPLEK